MMMKNPSICSIVLFSILLTNVQSKPPELVSLPAVTEAETDDSIVLTCSASKGTKPISFEWQFDGDRLFSSPEIAIDSKLSASILTLERVKPKHRGNFSCLAQNPDGSDRIFTMLDVRGIVFFLLFFSSINKL